MMSTSSVSRGRCCAPVLDTTPAKHVSTRSARATTFMMSFIGDDCNDTIIEGQRRFAVLLSRQIPLQRFPHEMPVHCSPDDLISLLCLSRDPAISAVTYICPGSSISRPQSRSIQITGLRDPVTVRRDERGIPYIDAKNDEDLYFAQGFITASDRLWQMDLFRRTSGENWQKF